MKVNRKELIKVLNIVQAGVSVKETVDQSASFVFTDGCVCSYNDETAVSYPFEIDLEGAIPAKEFYQLLTKLTKDEVELDIKDNMLYIKGRAKAGLRLDPEIKLPLKELGEPEKWITLPENFCEAIKTCVFTCSKDQTKPVLTNIHLTQAYAESCDNFRVTRFPLQETKKAFSNPLLLPVSSVKDILKVEPAQYAITQGWVHFKNEDDIIISCRVFEDDYPDTDKFVDVKGSTIEFPSTIQDMIDRASVLVSGERVSIALEDNSVKVSSNNDVGFFEEEGKAVYKGKPIEFEVVPEFMISILKYENEVTIGDRLMKFENEDFVHVVSLIKKKKGE